MNPTTNAEHGLALILDQDGTVSAVLRHTLSQTAAPVPGMPFDAWVGSLDGPKARELLTRARQEAAVFDWEMAVPEVDGPAVVLHFAAAAVPTGVLVMAAPSRDALELLSDELMRINNEQANALRTAEKEVAQSRGGRPDDQIFEELTQVNNTLANLQRELARRNAELKRSNEAKSRLLGMAAHDLRTPLGVILSYGEFLEAESGPALPAEQRQFLTNIRTTSEFMLRMVDELLDVAAIEAGRLVLAIVPMDLDALARHSVDLHSQLARRKEIGIRCDGPGAPLILEADAGKIEQVLNNLLGNAVKFSTRGTEVVLRVGVDGDGARLEVIDQGQGIPAEELDRLFTPFGTTSVRATEGEPSSGLGLAIVRRIVEGHGGSISVKSRVGAGSTFTVLLPGVPPGMIADPDHQASP